jgi:hypothetical protein
MRSATKRPSVVFSTATDLGRSTRCTVYCPPSLQIRMSMCGMARLQGFH